MESFGKAEMLAYMRQHKLAVVATIGADGGPQSALVGVGTTDAMEIVFDTLSTTRKHANLQRDRRIAVTFSGPGEMTLQYEGLAALVTSSGHEGEVYREAYYEAWPDGRAAGPLAISGLLACDATMGSLFGLRSRAANC